MSLMEPVLGIARPGLKFVLPAVGLTVIVAVIAPLFSVILLLLTGYLIWFFRDPNRKTPGIPNSLCCPADGKVVSVLEVTNDKFPEGRARRVAIFLNVFNVHVQRVPVGGKVTAIDIRPGKCGNALNEKCSEENEAVTVWLDTSFGVVGVRQISGAIARRILCFTSVGDELERGDRYGIIQFGSRVEIFLPLDATVKVSPGQKVVGGLTVLAVAFEEEVRKGMSRENLPKLSITPR